MNSNSSDIHDKNLSTIYDAIVGYHNTLVQVRFTIAGLYLAATGFLVNSWFSTVNQKSNYILIPFLGISLTLICWLLEVRTKHLLKNLGERGIMIEKRMYLDYIGFFELMGHQPFPAQWPFKKSDIPSSEFSKCIVSHTFGFNLIYVVILIFWIVIFFTSSVVLFLIGTLFNWIVFLIITR